MKEGRWDPDGFHRLFFYGFRSIFGFGNNLRLKKEQMFAIITVQHSPQDPGQCRGGGHA